MIELRWNTRGSVYRAIEPAPGEIEPHVALLRDWYNLEPNAAMMGNTVAMTDDDVRDAIERACGAVS